MRDKILTTVEEAFVIAEKFYNRTFDRPTHIEFKRNGSMGGYCSITYDLSKRELMFQLDLAENHPEDYRQTILHEVAHYVQFIHYGVRDGFLVNKLSPHGREWKYVMETVYNLSATRCHHYNTNNTITKKELRHIYGCACTGKEFKISTTMHNRIQNDVKMNPVKRWSASHGTYYSGKYYNKCCSKCKTTLILLRVGDPRMKAVNDLKQRLNVLQRRLDNQLQEL